MKRVILLYLLQFLLATFAFPQADKFVPYRVKQKWGFSDYSGKILIAPKYDSVNFFSNYNYIKQQLSVVYLGRKAGIINQTGESVIPVIYNSIEIGRTENGPINGIVASKDQKYGVIDFTNKVLIPFEYDTLALKDNYVVEQNIMRLTGYRFIGKIKGQYYSISATGARTSLDLDSYCKEMNTSFGITPVINEDESAESAAVAMDYMFGHRKEIIERNAQLIDSITTQTYGHHADVVVVYKNGKAGLVERRQLTDPAIKKMVPPVYDSIVDAAYDYEQKPIVFLIKKNKKISVVNLNGEELMPFVYEDYLKWNDWYVWTKKNNKVGVYNFHDKYEIRPQFDSIEYFGYNLWKVRLNGRSGFINKDGYRYFKD